MRGLAGILEIAEKDIHDKPLVLLLLSKVSLCLSELIPWQALIHNDGSTYSLRKLIWIESHLSVLFKELTKIADWQFSPHGLDALIWCRNKLEELGLISWRRKVRCVQIHGLTLNGVREMISRNNLFIKKLLPFSLSESGSFVSCFDLTAEEKLLRGLFNFLLLDVISSSIGSFSSEAFSQRHRLCGDLFLAMEDQLRVSN